MGCTIGVPLPAGAKDCLLATTLRLAVAPTQPAAAQWVLGVLSLRVKWPGYEAEVKKECRYTSITPYIFLVWCFVGTRDNFTFLPLNKMLLNQQILKYVRNLTLII
jgi:hypothetical protein